MLSLLLLVNADKRYKLAIKRKLNSSIPMGIRPLPSLTALRAFEATARLLSVKQAAAELSVTATAVSHQIRLLEEQLGQTLFVRTPRQLILTPKGSELLAGTSSAFDALAQVVQRVRTTASRQVVALSTTPAVASRWLLPRMTLLRELAPDLDLQLHISHEIVPLDGVGADMAIRYGAGQWPGLVAHHLFDNRFVPVCSPKLGLHQLEQMPDMQLLHFVPEGARDKAIGWPQWFKRAGMAALSAARGPRFSDETHAIAAAMAGQGVALVSRHLVQQELEAGVLVQPFAIEVPGHPFYLVYPEQRRDDPLVEAVRAWLLESDASSALARNEPVAARRRRSS